MRLKEPLQSMKTLNGHIVLHLAMFLVSWNVDIREYQKQTPAKPENQGGKLYDDNIEDFELSIFFAVRWGHLIAASFLMMSFILKSHQEYIVSKNLMLIVALAYFLPILAAMWCLRNVLSKKDGSLSDTYWSQVRRWFLLEQNLFCGQITAGVLFLFIAYTQRLQSFWNQNRPRYRVLADKQVVVDIWRDRSHQDYLHHLKFEFIQYVFFGTYLFTGILVMPFSNNFMKYPEYINESARVQDEKYNFVNMIQMGGYVLELFLLRVLLDPINRKGVKKTTRMLFCCSVQLIVLLIAVVHIGCLVFVLIDQSKNHLFQQDTNKTIILLWVEISIVTVPVKILYFIFTVRWLLKNRKLKQKNLNNQEIKEAICEGTGLQEQMDQFLNNKLQVLEKQPTAYHQQPRNQNRRVTVQRLGLQDMSYQQSKRLQSYNLSQNLMTDGSNMIPRNFSQQNTFLSAYKKQNTHEVDQNYMDGQPVPMFGAQMDKEDKSQMDVIDEMKGEYFTSLNRDDDLFSSNQENENKDENTNQIGVGVDKLSFTMAHGDQSSQYQKKQRTTAQFPIKQESQESSNRDESASKSVYVAMNEQSRQQLHTSNADQRFPSMAPVFGQASTNQTMVGLATGAIPSENVKLEGNYLQTEVTHTQKSNNLKEQNFFKEFVRNNQDENTWSDSQESDRSEDDFYNQEMRHHTIARKRKRAETVQSEIKFEISGKQEMRRESVISDFLGAVMDDGIKADHMDLDDFQEQKYTEEQKKTDPSSQRIKSFNLELPVDQNQPMINSHGNGNDVADDVSEAMTNRHSEFSKGQVETHIQMIEVMSKRANDKLFLFLDQDILACTILALFKANRRKFQITSEKQANLVNTTLIVFVVQMSLAACMLAYIQQYASLPNSDQNENKIFLNPFNQPPEQRDFTLFVAKFLAATIMHLNIFPNFANSMNIMKYVNNHPSRFDYQGLAFALGAFQCVSSFVYEVLNAVVLFTQISVYFALIYYITVYVISQLGAVYLQAVSNDHNNILFDMFLAENRPRVVKHRRDKYSWKRRSCCNKLQRLTFKFLRVVYISIFYYFVPFSFLSMHQGFFIYWQFHYDSYST